MAQFSAIVHETPAQREWRCRVRTLFDAVADRYARARSGYAAEIVEWLVATAGLTHGAQVLEIGCGTGQLTALLASQQRRCGVA